MTKAELTREIAERTGIERTAVLTIVEAFMDTVKSSLEGGEEVYLRGFGSFILKHRAEKPARNISANTTLIIPAHHTPHFKPSKEFLNRMKGGKIK